MSKSEGYLIVDHRASPGISPEAALRMGLDPKLVGEGKVFEAATKKCAHCPSVFIKNPLRTRPRGHCFQCNDYICDACDAARQSPDWVHRPVQEIIDLVTSGKWDLSGSTSLPVLTRKGTF